LSLLPLAERLAELAVDVGANVQPGQIVTVSADLGQEELVREIAARAYRRGARFVDVTYFDPQVKRARIERADRFGGGRLPGRAGKDLVGGGDGVVGRAVLERDEEQEQVLLFGGDDVGDGGDSGGGRSWCGGGWMGHGILGDC